MTEGALDRRQGLSLGYLVAGLIATAIYGALGSAPEIQSFIYMAIHITSLIAIAIGIRRYRPEGVVWPLIFISMVIYTLADTVFYLGPVAFGWTATVPSPSDAGFIVSYLFLIAALVLINKARSGGVDRVGAIDSSIVAIGLGALFWVLIMAPYVTDPSLSILVRLISLSYPVFDILLVGGLVRMALAPGARTPAFWLLGLGIVGQLFADVVLGVTLLNGTFVFGQASFLGWLVFFVTLGASAAHPTMTTLAEFKGRPQVSRARVAFLTLAALIPPTVLAWDTRDGDTEHVFVLTGATAVLFLLVMARLYNLVADLAERERLEKAKDEFISVVSHELRTPLTSIRGALGLVSGGAFGPLPEKAQRMMEIATSNTERLVRLINDILDIERMESGQAELVREPCDLQELTAKAANSLRALAGESGVTLSVSAESISVEVDTDRIEQTLTNLIGNAIKFSPDGGTVRISARKRDREAIVTVKDEGRGIPADKLESIFGRFEQIDASDAREKGGTGLGLAISRSIVRQHGGRIWAESVEGKGTTFSFTLPALQGATPSTPTPHGGPVVVLCDDDPSILEVVGVLLEKRGYGVITTTSGEETLRVAREQRPAVIILDMLMPSMSGADTVAVLKADPATSDIPVVILSVLAQRETTLSKDSIEGWIEKPLDDLSLFDALRRVLSASGESKKVLVIEDDFDLANVLLSMFSRHGLEGYHAGTGREAIRMSKRLKPDLLVLDLMLPDIDGFQVVDWLREDDLLSHVPMVVYTAAELTEMDRENLKLGDTEFLIKGRVTPEQFEERVSQLLVRVTAERPTEQV